MTIKKTSELLREAKALIDTPDKWMQGEYCNESSYEDSTCFCSLGAIKKTLGRIVKYESDTNRVSIALGKVIPGGYRNIASWNDESTHDQVMAKWNEAIALAEKEEANG